MILFFFFGATLKKVKESFEHLNRSFMMFNFLIRLVDCLTESFAFL